MFNFIIQAICYFVLITSALGFILFLVDLIRYSFSKKSSSGPLPWWVFWRP